jgi:16S rRNA processing protein RimM
MVADAGASAITSATPLATPADLVLVGRISGSYGVQGWLKVNPFNAAQESVLLASRLWWLDRAPGTLQIIEARNQGSTVVARAEGVRAREAAAALKGATVSVRRAEFPAGAEDEYYWVDLIGCEVLNPRGVRLGEVTSVDDHGAHSLLNIAGGDGVARMVPFVSAIIQSVDLKARRIVADWDLDY